MPRSKPIRKATATYLDSEEMGWLEELARRDGLDASAVLRMAFRRHAKAEGIDRVASPVAGQESAA
jgi:hypothetical protein